MRSHRLLLAACGLAMMGAAAPVGAQTTLPPGVDTRTLGPDDEVVVREYIVRRASPRVRYEEDVTLRPGSLVPRYVMLEPMSEMAEPRYRDYAYFVSPDDKLVVVDPVTRMVVRILDR